MSIDLDGNDYYILDAIRSISPRVIVAEYNAKFPPDIFWVMQYNEAHHWDSSDYFGASLKALADLLAARGYALVGCSVLGTNAFFVRKDLVAPPPHSARHSPPKITMSPRDIFSTPYSNPDIPADSVHFAQRGSPDSIPATFSANKSCPLRVPR